MKRNTAEIIMSFKSQMYAKHRKNTTENYSNAGAIMETLNYVSRVSELQMTEAKNREHCERQPHQRPKGPNKNGIGSVLCLWLSLVVLCVCARAKNWMRVDNCNHHRTSESYSLILHATCS